MSGSGNSGLFLFAVMHRIQAFFSYATADWDAPADSERVQKLVGGLAPQVRPILSGASFEIWQDRLKLRWGEDWRVRLEDEVSGSQLFVALVSLAWLRSDYCAREYEVFKARVEGRAGGRVLPILLREIGEADLERLPPDQQARYEELRKIQMERWTDLPRLDQQALNTTLIRAAEAVRDRIYALYPTGEARETIAAPPEAPERAQSPTPAAVVPPVSGDYYMPPQEQGQGTCLLRLATSGLSEAETELGTIVFAVTSLTVQSTVTGGRIGQENPEFSTAWDGPIATVTRIHAGPVSSALSIVAKGEELRGEPLVGLGDAGHVWIFDIEREEGAAVTVEGSVLVSRRALRIEEVDPPAEGAEARARQANMRVITDILMEMFFNDPAQLEPWSDD